MKALIVLSFMGIMQHAFSQQYQPDKVLPKAITSYEKAMVLLADGSVKNAIPLLEKSIQQDPNYVDAYLSLAGVYGELKNYELAIKYYEMAKSKDSLYFKIYHLPYSINLAGLGKWKQAANAIETFLSISNLSEKSLKSAAYRKKCYEFAIQYEQKKLYQPYQFNPINLGDSVNSPQSEYLPSLTVDDSLLVFSRRGTQGGEYFFQSNIHQQKYSKAQLVKGDINEEPFKGALSISADAEWMVFAGELAGKNFGSYDLYISYNTPNGWSDPINLGEPINTGYWESAPCLSPDKKALYFASNRPNGFGGSDIYVCYRDEKGRWGKPINMGEQINTMGDETAPYIHADNQTLYFTSNGLAGYGGSDMFVCRKGPFNSWSVPENLGYPINTIENEGSLAVSADGIHAFYASDRSDSRGGLDLYSFELPEQIRPFKTLYVKGFVYDNQTKKGLPSGIELIDNATGKPTMQLQTDETGFYFTTLPTNKDYTFVVNRKGYVYYNKTYAFSNKQADSTYKQDIFLEPLAIKKSIVFKNVLFEINSFQLKDTNNVELNELAQLLLENPNLRIEIIGHTDNTGDEEKNIILSTKRAKSIVSYLIEKRIAINRLTYKGLGSSTPIADNQTEAGKAANRRTEFVIIGL